MQQYAGRVEYDRSIVRSRAHTLPAEEDGRVTMPEEEDRRVADLEGGRVLLTGASNGIGREQAKLLAGRGARLAIVGRRAASAGDVRAQENGARREQDE